MSDHGPPSHSHAADGQTAARTARKSKINHPQLNRARPTGHVSSSGVCFWGFFLSPRPPITQAGAETPYRLCHESQSPLTRDSHRAQRISSPKLPSLRGASEVAGLKRHRGAKLPASRQDQTRGAKEEPRGSRRAAGRRAPPSCRDRRRRLGAAPRPAESGAGAVREAHGPAPGGRARRRGPPLPPRPRPRRRRPLPAAYPAPPEPPPPPLRAAAGAWEPARRGGRAERGDEHGAVAGQLALRLLFERDGGAHLRLLHHHRLQGAERARQHRRVPGHAVSAGGRGKGVADEGRAGPGRVCLGAAARPRLPAEQPLRGGWRPGRRRGRQPPAAGRRRRERRPGLLAAAASEGPAEVSASCPPPRSPPGPMREPHDGAPGPGGSGGGAARLGRFAAGGAEAGPRVAAGSLAGSSPAPRSGVVTCGGGSRGRPAF